MLTPNFLPGDSYPDRKRAGRAFMPRANRRDYPRGETLVYNKRIAYYVDENGAVHILGGDDFDISQITDEMWLN
jgi:hypothetical protein